MDNIEEKYIEQVKRLESRVVELEERVSLLEKRVNDSNVSDGKMMVLKQIKIGPGRKQNGF